MHAIKQNKTKPNEKKSLQISFKMTRCHSVRTNIKCTFSLFRPVQFASLRLCMLRSCSYNMCTATNAASVAAAFIYFIVNLCEC